MKNFYEGIVVTCRVRLARNLSGYNFASTLTDRASAREIINKTFSLVSQFGQFDLYEISKISQEHAQRLKEDYVISEALRKNTFSGAVAVARNLPISVMINEEDHIRSQCILKGEDLLTAYAKLAPLDRWLNNNLKFSKNSVYGFLTACPTNLGTGLRASAMMFLPTLHRNNMMNDLYQKAKQNGLTVRGVFGEGSQGQSALYQISNEVTMGKSEVEIIRTVQSYVEEIAKIEQLNSLTYFNQHRLEVEDEIHRAISLLTNCRLLSYEEFSYLLPLLKWGVMLKIINVSDMLALDDLLIKCRPANLRFAYYDAESADNRAIRAHLDKYKSSFSGKEEQALQAFRAEYVKNSLRKIIK